MSLRNVFLTAIVFFLPASAAWADTAPRFQPPTPFQRSEISNLVSCRAALMNINAAASTGDLPANKNIRAKTVNRTLEAWSDRGGYTKEQLQKLANFEMSLSPERTSYVTYQSKNEGEQNFLSFRIFDGNVRLQVSDHRLPLERKFPGLSIDRKTPVFEVGLFGATETVHEAARSIIPLLENEAQERIHRGLPFDSRFVLTARPVQARLYRQIGFRVTSLKTSDGMMVMEISFKELSEIATKVADRTLLTKEDYRRTAAESAEYSKAVQENYRDFWSKETMLKNDPKKYENQWSSYSSGPAPSVREYSRAESSWLFPATAPFYSSYHSVRSQDLGRRSARYIAARLVVEDRKQQGLTSSFALRRLVEYQSDFAAEYLPGYGARTMMMGGGSVGSGNFRIDREPYEVQIAADEYLDGANRDYYQSLLGARPRHLERQEQVEMDRHQGRDW